MGGGTGHPHACGDYPFVERNPKLEAGPSPRVWGLPPVLRRPRRWPRAIPTRVGTTCPSRWSRWAPPGHPHACGDYETHAWKLQRGGGPSPRVWGLLDVQGPNPGPNRAIPTRVGTTAPPLGPRCVWTGHPHACGDYSLSWTWGDRLPGPSPRVWGLPQVANGFPTTIRAIPTRVGTTLFYPPVPWRSTGPSPRVWGLLALPPR